MLNVEHSTTNVEVVEKSDFIERNLLSKTSALAPIAAKILFLAFFGQKKIVAESGKRLRKSFRP